MAEETSEEDKFDYASLKAEAEKKKKAADFKEKIKTVGIPLASFKKTKD